MKKDSRTSTSFQVSEDSALQQDGQDLKQSPSVRTHRSVRESSKSIGPMFPSSPTSETSTGQSSEGQLSLPGDRHVKEQALQQLFKGSEPEKLYGPRWQELSGTFGQIGLLLSNLPEMKNGKIKLRLIWRKLAIILPDLNDRLLIVAHLISAGACSLLPTCVASDSTRSPGSESHPRLKKSRGLRLQEELGARPGPEIAEWMMGYPIGWTELKQSEMPSFPKSPMKSSDVSQK